MKKIKYIILATIFLFPITVKADYEIANYIVDITILENGDMDIKEAFQMTGIYNGYEKTIKYKNNYLGYKGEKLSSTDNYHLYDAKGISLNEIRAINFRDTSDINTLIDNSNLFEKVTKASKGDYGVYTISKNYDKDIIKIYNPNKINKDFYISYKIKNLVVNHDDISELASVLFSEIAENINHAKIYIHIPNNKTLLKGWIHGKQNNLEIVDNQNICINIDNILVSDNIDFRVIFDKEAITDINKKSKEIVLNKIINIEDELYDKINNPINQKYEKIKETAYNSILTAEKSKDKTDYKEAMILVNNLKDDEFKTELLMRLMNLEPKIERKITIVNAILYSLIWIWLIGQLVILYYIYRKYDKKNIVKTDHDVDENILPSTLGYLLRRKLNNGDLVATILKMIKDKKITYEKCKNNKDYQFVKQDNGNLTLTEERILKLIFNNDKQITLNKIISNSSKNNTEFINKYSNWLNAAMVDAASEQFYADTLVIKIIGIIYGVVGIMLGTFLLDKIKYVSPLILMLISLLFIIYFILLYKRTPKGNLYYKVWINKKYNINHLKNINNSDLDNMIIYSIILENYDKITKILSNKLSGEKRNNLFDIIENYKNINYTINTALEEAYNKEKTR